MACGQVIFRGCDRAFDVAAARVRLERAVAERREYRIALARDEVLAAARAGARGAHGDGLREVTLVNGLDVERDRNDVRARGSTGDTECERPADAGHEAGEDDRCVTRGLGLRSPGAATGQRGARRPDEQEREDDDRPPAAHAPYRTRPYHRNMPERAKA